MLILSYKTGTLSYGQRVINSGPDGYWKFDEASGTFNDEIGSSDSDTVSNITYSQAPAISTGNSIGFSGNSNIGISTGTATTDIFGPIGTFELWIYPQNMGANQQGKVAQKGDNAETRGYAIYAQQDSGVLIQFGFYSAWSGNQGEWKTTAKFALDTWYHLAVVWDSSSPSNIPLIYVDGTSEPLTTLLTPTGTYGTDILGDFLNIGSKRSNNHWFTGRVDDYAIYKKALTGTEISEHANAS